MSWWTKLRSLAIVLVLSLVVATFVACSGLAPASFIVVVLALVAAGGLGIGCSQAVRVGDGDGDGDCDNDGISDEEDNCPEDANATQEDRDGDGIGDVCDFCPEIDDPDMVDSDLDGIGDGCDDFPDYDADGVADDDDNCPFVFNPDQENSDETIDELVGAIVGDACEACYGVTPCADCCGDPDGDGVIAYQEPSLEPGLFGDNCPFVSNPEQEDRDEDGVGNVCDNCPNVANPDQLDTNADRIGDACPEDVPEFCASAEQVPSDRRELIESFVARGVIQPETREVLLG